MMRGVLLGLGYSEKTEINEIDTDLSRIGLGIGDDWKLARMLSQKFAYTNSYLHKFPKVDLLSPPRSCIEYFEFVTCSDVLEHTPPPRKKAISGIFRMLKPRGFAVISVPIKQDDIFREYYPDLFSWNVSDGELHWGDSGGGNYIDKHPEFHGGEGLTITFRQWNKKQLEDDLSLAGFSEVVFLPNMGFQHSDKDIALVVARK
jgi:SAM-dependent methyltransferase